MKDVSLNYGAIDVIPATLGTTKETEWFEPETVRVGTRMLVESETVIRMGLVFACFCQLREGVGGCPRALTVERNSSVFKRSRFNFCCALPAGLYALPTRLFTTRLFTLPPLPLGLRCWLGYQCRQLEPIVLFVFFHIGDADKTQIQYHNSLKI